MVIPNLTLIRTLDFFSIQYWQTYTQLLTKKEIKRVIKTEDNTKTWPCSSLYGDGGNKGQ